jgi:HD-GYP domain-containing protein (c-di-GMP phosphodiesterase class II)
MPSTNLLESVGADQLRKVLEEASWRANLSLILLDTRGQVVLQSHPMIGTCAKVGPRGSNHRQCPVRHTGVIQDLAGKQGPLSFPCPAHTGYSVLARVIAPRSFLSGAMLACLSPREDSSWREELFFLTAARIQELAEIAQEIESLAQEVAHSYEELSLLYDISAELTAVSDAPTVCRHVLEKATSVIQAKRGAIFLTAEGDSHLEPIAVKGFGVEAAADFAARSAEGLIGRVMATGEGELLEDQAVLPDEERLEPQDRSPLAPPLIVCSLKVRERVLGVIVIANKAYGKHFTSGDLKLLTAIASQAAVALLNTRVYEESRHILLSTIRSLVAAIDARDSHTIGHSERVTKLAVAIGSELGLPSDELEDLMFAAELHDIGKLTLPDSIFAKRDRLTAGEWEMVMRHPERGAEMIMHIRHMERILPGILHHHERYDGKGYPRGLSGIDIPINARIIAVADSFDAITSSRPYRHGATWTAQQVLEELEALAGSQYDPTVCRALGRAWRQGRIDEAAMGPLLRRDG